MENEKQFTEFDSIHVIQQMINTVKTELEDKSFYYLIWGWLVFVASIGNYYLLSIGYNNAELTWAGLMPAGGIITAIYSSKQGKQKRIVTYIDEVMKYVIIAFLVSLFMILFAMQKLQLNTYPMVLMVYAIWLFISGGIIKFKPLIIGGLVNWVLGIAAFFVSFQYQLLLVGLAMLLGYIIPGYMLKAKNKKLTAA